ncbi:MAG: Rpn family recombination-promoting nuclease/putative transposase, partial [Clostridia bacterium]|nr:Rpn family recombination-promoting nuclease/putative transposase [Clostridia bacterium]
MANPIEKLTIMNNFLFGVVMRQEQFCKSLLEYILEVKIRKIVYVNEQESFEAGIPNAKSVRLGVYVEDDADTVYDLEVQTTNKRNLGKRTRFYQSMIDIRVLEKGQNYRKLKKSFIIFICNYDPYGKSRYIYTFRN